MRKTHDMCLRLSLCDNGVFRTIIQDHGDPDLFTTGTDSPNGSEGRNAALMNWIGTTARKDASIRSRILAHYTLISLNGNRI